LEIQFLDQQVEEFEVLGSKPVFLKIILHSNFTVCPKKASSVHGTIDPLTLQKPSSAEKCPVIVIHHPSFTINSIHRTASI